ncbi:MAG: hypothetical protein QOG42_1692 [Solirubrobacteraceae bacterium]|jgi:hypothetical protein|nr:hypothetical protein [Solirubrobacteraceae bacterium]
MLPARHTAALAPILAALALGLSACTQVEESENSYEPTSVHPIKGREVQRVTFTAEAARRAGVQLARVSTHRGHHVIPYAALIYNDEGDTYTYVSARPLEYVRTPIEVARIAGDEVLLEHSPPVGTRVVTTGAAEVYSAEFGVEE